MPTTMQAPINVTEKIISIVAAEPTIVKWDQVFALLKDTEIVTNSDIYPYLEKNQYMQYQNNDPIKYVEKIVTQEKILVTSEHTGHFNLTNVKILTEKELLNMVRNYKKLCKEQNVKLVGANKRMKWIKDNYNEYISQAKEFQALFNDLANKINNHTLRVGYSIDFEYSEMQKINSKLSKMKYNSTVLGKMLEFISKDMFRTANNFYDGFNTHYI